jgi:simple sugar transport system permease protein
MSSSEIQLSETKLNSTGMLNRLLDRFIVNRELMPLTLLVLIAVAFYIANPAFLSPLNLSNMFAFIPELGIIALGMTFLLIAGEFDLSVGAVFAFVPVLMFILFNEGFLPIEAGFFVGLVIAALLGYITGLLVTKVRISSFLVTIGMMLIVRGLALYVSEGFPQATWETDSILKTILVGTIPVGPFKVNAGLLWFILLAVIMSFILHHTRFGNWMMATGGNVKSARARGINTDKVKVLLFVQAAVLAAFAGIISATRVASAYPIAGTGYELEVIAMSVVGGTSLFGGRGTIIGTVLGVILLRSIRNGIIVVGVPGLAY